jgi:hypothetical protein
MHSSRELRSDSFDITVGGRPATVADVFEGFSEQDRLGVVVRRPCGAVGASALICATITAFYDIQRASSTDFFVTPSTTSSTSADRSATTLAWTSSRAARSQSCPTIRRRCSRP